MTKSKQEKAAKAKDVCSQLSELYKKKLLPLETAYKFHEFHSPPLAAGDFTAKPMILLLGQYSTGKTTFIKHLLGQDFPGMRIGPEPTTDGFIIVMGGDTEGTIPGNALVSDSSKPFTPLSKFGNAFLTRLQCSQVKSSVLDNMTIIDTPGILSGEKQRIDRGYDYPKVIEWMAEHVDRIILLFDAHKLDISDEFKRVIESLRGYDEKVRIVLNKADRINTQQLMRVYGALMWGLGKVLGTPEVARVYIGSFWDQPLVFSENRKLFDLEQKDLLDDLGSQPSQSALRKLNDLIRRARLAKVHAHIISSLKGQMPIFGKEKKKKTLIDGLQGLFENIAREQNISVGDFPKTDRMQTILNDKDFSAFLAMKPKLIADVDRMLEKDIPGLMTQLSDEIKTKSDMKLDLVIGGAFQPEQDNPFGADSVLGVNEGKFSGPAWIVDKYREPFDQEFYSLDVMDGKVSGSQAREVMIKSQLPQTSLRQIWTLADLDSDGMLDIDEFALAKYLIKLKLDGEELPNQLPAHLIPLSKRNLVSL